MTDPERLVHAYLDDDIGPQGFAELCGWLESDERHVRDFVFAQAMHADMSDWVNMNSASTVAWPSGFDDERSADTFIELLTALDDHDGRSGPAKIIGSRATRGRDGQAITKHDVGAVAGYLFREALRARLTWVGVAAAVVLITVVIFVPFGGGGQGNGLVVQPETHKQPAQAVATLTDTVGASWDGAAPLVGGAFFSGQPVTLTHGYAKLRFENEAEVILEGPCVFQPLSGSRIRLDSGRLYGVCQTERSRGFTVRAGDAQIVDLGTRFGVVVDSTNRAHPVAEVHVYEGSVAVGPASVGVSGDPPTRLSANEAGRVDIRTGTIEPIAFDSRAGHVSWHRLAWKPVVIDGQVRFESDAPVSLRKGDYEHAAAVRLLLEKHDVILRSALPVDFVGPGAITSEQLSEAQADGRPALPAGSPVTSYLIHGDSVGDDTLEARGSVTFPGRIVGVIAVHDGLVASDKLLGLDGVRYYNADDTYPRGIADPLDDDTIRISDDRRTLEFEYLFGSAIDQVRVLVAADAEED